MKIQDNTPCLELDCTSEGIVSFWPLLQQGFMVKALVGCSLKTMLCEQFNVLPEYIEDRIKTIFLDGQPVDDVDTAIVRDGCTVALSAAMPGLVGATLRRGSCLASFRGTITHCKESASDQCSDGMVVLKLFNLLVKEMGPAFLAQGLCLSGKDLAELFGGWSADFRSKCKALKIDDQEIGLEQFNRILSDGAEKLFLLKVSTKQ